MFQQTPCEFTRAYSSFLGWLHYVSFPCQAVQQNGQSLQHASDELQMDPELQKVVGRLKMSKNPGS